MSAFKVGQQVSWSSSSAGSTVEKVGTVVAVLRPGERNVAGAINIAARQLNAHSAYGHGMHRDHESYIVHVAGKTDRSKGTIYWPRVAALREVAA